MNYTEIIYGLVSTLAILMSFLCFLISFNITFKDEKGLFLKFKLREILRLFRSKPIRSGLTAISFLMFFSVLTSYFVQTNIDINFVIRYSLSRIPLLFASLIILWMIIEIELGEWTLNVKKKNANDKGDI